MRRLRFTLAIIALTPGAVQAEIGAANIPKEVIVAVEREIRGLRITGAEKKERQGRQYFDVKGVRADGVEVELDVLLTTRGWEVVEIQRDIAWSDVPEIARNAALSALNGITPARVIESRQMDARIIYELFKPGDPETPAYEIMVDRGKAHLLTKAWPH